MSEHNVEEVYVPDHDFAYVVPVKFHNTAKSYTFGTDNPNLVNGEVVVVETVQGIELGECQGASSPKEKANIRTPLRPVLRIATDRDKQDFKDNFEHAARAKKICQEEIEDLKLNMHLLSATYLLDRSKVLFVYTADQRVDFRELLKRLGSRLHCRIELRQIGDRDQSKMVGVIGMCGMECCCARFKNHFDNISINMAKNQQLALNIEKLSGMCGKLMCCLKYENDTYSELTEGLPKLGAHIEYDGELYRVSSINVIAQEARIENSESYLVVTTDELREKAIIRKGVTIKKAADGSRPKRQSNPSTDNRRNNNAANIDTTQVGISSLSKKNESSGKPLNMEKTNRSEKSRQKSAKDSGNRSNRPAEKGLNSRNNANQRKQNRRRPEKPVSDNPNITVRSFKSSKTKKEEKGN